MVFNGFHDLHMTHETFRSPQNTFGKMDDLSNHVMGLLLWCTTKPTIILTMWGPPVISWFINPINYSYKL